MDKHFFLIHNLRILFENGEIVLNKHKRRKESCNFIGLTDLSFATEKIIRK
jgi:hypothetical protein